jgi:hypothetical protein
MPNARHPERDPVGPEQEPIGEAATREGKRRIGDLFLDHWRQLLGDHGFIPDPGEVERTASGGIVYYRYTHPEHLDAILAPDGGPYARLPVVQSERSAELAGGYITEGLLEPLPGGWATPPTSETWAWRC